MPFLGSKNCHEKCSARIQDYLERGGRALAHDFVWLSSKDERRAWAYFMDRTRAASGNDQPWRGRQAVTYYHFIVSPDPRDAVDLDTLRELTMDWVHEFFGSEEATGKLGSYEVAVVYHDDNTHRVPHAHVIVNNTDLDSGYRLQIDNRTNKHGLADRLQELAAERGLRFFDNDNPDAAQQQRKRYYTRIERAMKRDGRFVWKDDLANKIDIARRTTSSVPEFEEELDVLRVGHDVRDGDYLFTHPSNPQRWKSCGYRLGADYTKDAIAASIDHARRSHAPRNEVVKQNVNDYVMRNFIENMELAAVVDYATTVEEVANALRVSDQFGLRSPADFQARAASLRRAAATAGAQSDSGKGYTRQADEIEAALAVVQKASFFNGVEIDTAQSGSRTTGSPHGAGAAGGASSNRQRASGRSMGRKAGSPSASRRSRGGPKPGASGRRSARR